MNNTLTVVACPSHLAAVDSADIFASWLELYEPWNLSIYDPFSNSVRIPDGFTFLFVDYRIANMFNRITDSIIDQDSFFVDLADHYETEFMGDDYQIKL